MKDAIGKSPFLRYNRANTLLRQ